MPEHCGTPPRGQGQFNFGNSTGTVLITGFGKMFVHEFGSKRSLKVLRRIYFITKNAKT